MTFEELKTEAEKQGYKLIKKQPYIPLATCPVCDRRPALWYHVPSGEFYKCDICGLTSDFGRTNHEAREKWNRMVFSWLEGERYVG